MEDAGYVLQLRERTQARLESRRGLVERLRVRALERELVEALGELAADADGGRHLHEDAHAGYRGELRPEPLDHGVGARALRTRLQVDEHAPLVERRPGGRAR